MNSTPDPPPPDFDKTLIEGENQLLKTGLTSGARADAGQTTTNPYQRAISDPLPSGTEPITLGSGTVAGMLGAGGMARVYKVWNEKLEVFRAVKVIIPSNQSDLKSRFETEAKITAKLHHPNIVEIYSVGDWNGLPFLEMEFIDGESLENLLQKHGRLPDSVCSAVCILVARALTYAHGQQFLLYGKNYNGVIHRDLKPANIMISREGMVKLMDFGIARPTDASFHTVEGSVVGTLQYLSPEQLDGVGIDARADLYAFGAILYEMLTGDKTFPQKTITNLMKTKAINQYRRFEDFDFHINAALARIAQKCLQVAPDNRYHDAKGLLTALEAAHRTISADPPEAVITNYIADPVQFKVPKVRKRPAWLKPVFIVPAASAAVLGIVVAVVVMTAPQGIPDQKSVANQDTLPVARPVIAPVPDSSLLAADSVRPLAPEPMAKNSDTTKRIAAVSGGDPARAPRQTAARPRTAAGSQERAQRTPDAPQPASPLERLQQKYRTTDPVTIGRLALAVGAYRDAIEVLEKLPPNHPEFPKRTILLLDAYLQANRLSAAMGIVVDSPVKDGQFEFLSAKLYLRRGEYTNALARLDLALSRDCITRGRREVINDAMYYIAQTRAKIHETTPNAENKQKALDAWMGVKKTYINSPDHPRLQEAMNALLALR